MKRTIKFKDGTKGRYEVKEQPRPTMFRCNRGAKCVAADDGNAAFLNSSEFTHGNTCSACLISDKLSAEKREEAKANKAVEKDIFAVLTRVTQMDDSDIILSTGSIWYVGQEYSYKILNRKGLRFPKLFIQREGVTIWDIPEVVTDEGRQVRDEMRAKELITVNVG